MGATPAGSLRPRVSALGTRTISAIVLLGVTVALVACGGSSRRAAPPPAPADSRAVTFATTDGVMLSGRVFVRTGAGSTAVVLAHTFETDQRVWYEYADELADEGYRVLTFDFRGYCPGGDGGCSEGAKDPAAAPLDVQAAIAMMREGGAADIALVGASFGGTASIVAASQDPTIAIATLSAPARFAGMDAASALPLATASTLFIAGIDDTNAVASAEELYAAAPQPKRIEILTSADHGTDLLTGAQGSRVRTMLTAFLLQFAPAKPV